jgi:hypothetical protein
MHQLDFDKGLRALMPAILAFKFLQKAMCNSLYSDRVLRGVGSKVSLVGLHIALPHELTLSPTRRATGRQEEDDGNDYGAANSMVTASYKSISVVCQKTLRMGVVKVSVGMIINFIR